MPSDEIKLLLEEIGSLKKRLKRVEDSIFRQEVSDDNIDMQEYLDDNLLYAQAISIIQEYDLASASLLQRRLSIGYTYAANILDRLEKEGYVSKADGNKPRTVLRKN